MNLKISLQFFLLIVLLVHSTHGQSFDPCESAEDGELVRGPVNCSHYIICDADEPTDDYCEDGLMFNPDTQDCEDADDVDCSEYGSDEEYDYYSYEDESEEEEEEESEENDVTTESKCPQTDDPSKVVFLPSKQSCSEYFLCYHGLPLSMHCTNSLHFNAATNRCDFPKNANCRVDYEHAVTTSPKCDKSVFMEMYPHPTQCDYYYYCRKGYLSIQQCPFFFYFDAASKTCRIRTGHEC